jgi:hypothetical protein
MRSFALRAAGGIATAIACSEGLASCVDDLDANYGTDAGTGGSDDAARAQDAGAGEPGAPTDAAALDGGADDAFVDGVTESEAVDGTGDAKSVDDTGDAKSVDASKGVDGSAESSVDAGVTFHGETQYLMKAGGAMTLDQPPASAPGDALIAALLFGNISAPNGATVTAPSGWTELCQAAVAPDNAAVFVYWAVSTASLVWPAQWPIEGGTGGGNVGVAWLLSYGGVDTTKSPACSAQTSQSADNGVTWPSPMLASGAGAGVRVVATFGSFAWNPDGGAAITSWSLPGPWIARSTDLAYQRRSGIVGDLDEKQAITSFEVTARASGQFVPQYVVSAILALKPM